MKQRLLGLDALGWAWVSLIANTVIILTGGLVRLTGSGLGCPTFPRCTEESFVPHGALGVHGAIEFGNRLITFVLIAVAIATFVAVWRWEHTSTFARKLALVLGVGIPLQAAIGGITVLTSLNPWIVAFHLVLSLALVVGSVVLITHIDDAETESRGRARAIYEVDSPSRHLIWWAYGVLLVAIYLGTIVTGSGPHAGDVDAPRNGLDPQWWSRIHALSVWLFIALVVIVLVRTRLLVAIAVLIVALAQGLIGYVQYFTDLPIALVAAHLVGGAILLAVATRLVLVTRSADVGAQPMKGSSAAATNSRAR